jgi:hypothetical protein
MKFYPQDWRADEKLRLCSLAARGLWIEILAIMHRSERYGQLLIGGHVPTDAQLAVQVGAPTEQVSELIGQLEEAGVFSRAASGAIYSRRMTRDHRRTETARKNGKNGGNPSLQKQTEKADWDNQSDKAPLKPQRPEARHSVSNETGAAPPADVTKAVFDLGVQLLIDSGKTEPVARSLVGKWRKAHKDGPVLQALLDCQARRISNPVEWMPKRLSEASPRTQAADLIADTDRYRRRAA